MSEVVAEVVMGVVWFAVERRGFRWEGVRVRVEAGTCMNASYFCVLFTDDLSFFGLMMTVCFRTTEL